MAYLKWISDENLVDAVQHLIDKAHLAKQKAKDEFGKNVIDPFSALFELSGFDMTHDEWIISETTRQAQKTLQNHIGEFHQIVLGSVKGWENMKTGQEIDLCCSKKKVIAEIKNKYNTISGGLLGNLYTVLYNLVMNKASKYKDYTAYYVMIIPKSPVRFDLEFTPSDKSKGTKFNGNKNVRVIDGASFYDLATGQKDSLSELFQVLPSVIEKCSKRRFSVSEKIKLRAFFDAAYVHKN